MKKVLRKMNRIQFDSLGRVIKKPQNYKGKKLIKSNINYHRRKFK